MTNTAFRTAALAQLPTLDASGQPFTNYSDKALLTQLECIDKMFDECESSLTTKLTTLLTDELLEMQEQGYWFDFDIEEATLEELQAAYDYYVSPADMAEAAEECANHPKGTSNAIHTAAKASARIHYAFKTMPWQAIASEVLLLAVQACYYTVVAIVWTIEAGAKARKAYEGSKLQSVVRTLHALDKSVWDYVAIRRTVKGTYESKLVEQWLLGS